MDTDTIKTGMKSSLKKFTLTDLHTHILPGIDDGAKSLDSSLKMLVTLKQKNVERTALTPHFYPAKEDLSGFISKRERAYNLLLSAWDVQTMPQLQLGAEVHYTPKIVELDLHRLTIGESNYLLLELPDTGTAAFVEQTIDAMLLQRITPILAHVERCRMLREDPGRLLGLIQMGALAQVSAGALTGRADSFTEVCLQNGLAQIVSSDIHNLKDRNCLLDATSAGRYADIIRWSESFARAIWDKSPLPAFTVKAVKRGLFGYRPG